MRRQCRRFAKQITKISVSEAKAQGVSRSGISDGYTITLVRRVTLKSYLRHNELSKLPARFQNRKAVLLSKTCDLSHVFARSTAQTPHRGVCSAQNDAVTPPNKKDRGLKDASPDSTGSDSLLSSVAYSISQIVPCVNSKDLLRYLPDDMLNTEFLCPISVHQFA